MPCSTMGVPVPASGKGVRVAAKRGDKIQCLIHPFLQPPCLPPFFVPCYPIPAPTPLPASVGVGRSGNYQEHCHAPKIAISRKL